MRRFRERLAFLIAPWLKPSGKTLTWHFTGDTTGFTTYEWKDTA